MLRIVVSGPNGFIDPGSTPANGPYEIRGMKAIAGQYSGAVRPASIPPLRLAYHGFATPDQPRSFQDLERSVIYQRDEFGYRRANHRSSPNERPERVRKTTRRPAMKA